MRAASENASRAIYTLIPPAREMLSHISFAYARSDAPVVLITMAPGLLVFSLWYSSRGSEMADRREG
jgi:hypothetical protein